MQRNRPAPARLRAASRLTAYWTILTYRQHGAAQSPRGRFESAYAVRNAISNSRYALGHRDWLGSHVARQGVTVVMVTNDILERAPFP